MKKGVKILIILLFLIIIGLVSYIVVDKTILSKNKSENKEESKSSSAVKENEKENEDVGSIILSEINKKEFLSKNGIREDDVNLLEYCIVETKDNPIYIVLVSYQAEGEAGHGNIFQVIYRDGQVIFDKIEDHKYLSDVVAYDSNKEMLKLEATYHDRTRTNYYKLSNGKFEGIDLAVADGSKEYDFKELKTTKIEITKKTESKEKTSNKEISNDDYREYLGRWEDGFGEVEIKNIGNGYITFSYGVIRLGGIDDATVPFNDGKGIFYFHGYSDSNFNNEQEDDEYYYRKGTIKLKDNSVVIDIEDVTHEELSKNLQLDKSNIMSGAVYLTPETTHTFREKAN